jgi:hypothetical protein
MRRCWTAAWGAAIAITAAGPAQPAAADYDIVAGIGVDAVEATLAGLYETHVWPHAIPAADLGLSVGDLRDFSDDLPDTDGLTVGDVRLTGPPTVGVDVHRTVLATQAFAVDVHVGDGSVATSLRGSLTVPVRLATRPAGDDFELVWLVEDEEQRQEDADDSVLTIPPESPIQPKNSLVNFFTGRRIAFGLLEHVGDRRLPFSPALAVPHAAGGGSTEFRLQRADVRGVDAPERDALVVGLQFGRGPAGTLTDPFRAGSPGNVVVSIDEAFLDELADASIPAVQAKVRRKIRAKLDKVGLGALAGDIANFAIDNVQVRLVAPDRVRVTADAKFKDFCGPGPFNEIDLDFDLSGDVRISTIGGDLSFTRPAQASVDYSDSDLALCALTGGMDLAGNVLAAELATTVTAVTVGALYTGDTDPEFNRLRSVFVLDQPVPMTELLPRLSVTRASVDGRRMALQGTLRLVRDDVHTFVYAVVGTDPASGRPLPARLRRRARVELIDQDRPPPRADDIAIPEERTTVKTAGRLETTTTVDYRPPTVNETLGAGRTDGEGLVRLVVDRASGGGVARVTRSVERTNVPVPDPKVTVTTHPIGERRPDVFFRVTLRDGQVFISPRARTHRFYARNFADRRIGAPDAPQILVVAPRARRRR